MDIGRAASTRPERAQSECRRATRRTRDLHVLPIKFSNTGSSVNFTIGHTLSRCGTVAWCPFACTSSVPGSFSWSTWVSWCWTCEPVSPAFKGTGLRRRGVAIDTCLCTRLSRAVWRCQPFASRAAARRCGCGWVLQRAPATVRAGAACRERRWCYAGRVRPPSGPLLSQPNRRSRSLRTRQARGRAARPPWARPRRRCAARQPTPPRRRSLFQESNRTLVLTMRPFLLFTAS